MLTSAEFSVRAAEIEKLHRKVQKHRKVVRKLAHLSNVEAKLRCDIDEGAELLRLPDANRFDLS